MADFSSILTQMTTYLWKRDNNNTLQHGRRHRGDRGPQHFQILTLRLCVLQGKNLLQNSFVTPSLGGWRRSCFPANLTAFYYFQCGRHLRGQLTKFTCIQARSQDIAQEGATPGHGGLLSVQGPPRHRGLPRSLSIRPPLKLMPSHRIRTVSP